MVDTATTTYKTLKLTYKTDPSAGDIPAYVHYNPSIPSSSSSSSKENARPIVLIFHAGGFVSGTHALIPTNQIEFLVQQGVVVVTPEYRLCPQVGLEEGPMEDARRGLEWCRQELGERMMEEEEEEEGVKVDGERVAVMGHSAGGTLGLYLGTLPNPPLAILDLYSTKNFADPFWSKPLAAFASIPDLDQVFLDKVYEGPVPYTAPPMFRDGRPDLSNPRSAWLLHALKHGTHMPTLLRSSGTSLDPTTHFTANFPPTTFIHGTSDVFSPVAFAAEAERRLREDCGVKDTQLILVEGEGHVFDMGWSAEEERWKESVGRGLRWLVEKVRA